MSNGRVHDRLSQDLEIPIPIIGIIIHYHFSHNLLQAGLCGLIILIGITVQRFATPDLDIIENKNYKYGYYPLYVIKYNFGEIPYLIWKYFWMPYALVTPHRAWWSHGFIIGTLVRIVYFFIPIVVLGYFLGNILGYPLERTEWHLISTYWPYLAYFTLGWFLSDCGHLFLDYNFSFRRFYEKMIGPAYQWHTGTKVPLTEHEK